MPGVKIYNLEGLLDFIRDLNKIDNYKEKRQEILKLTNVNFGNDNRKRCWDVIQKHLKD